MLISTEYRELNKSVHENDADYGIVGQRYANLVSDVVSQYGVKDILDYGCGKGTLSRTLTFPIREYDPCIPGKDSPPEPAELVVSTDVLEHIEPDCLNDVLDDIKRLATRAVFLTVATAPAGRILPDGRNAHLIVEPASWWLPLLMERWDLKYFQAGDGEFYVILE